MIAQYKPNEKDQGILSDITGRVVESLEAWYGHGSHLDERTPQIRSYRNSFMLRYIITLPSQQKKTVLVKIRRNPKMDSLLQAIQADIHQNIPNEFRSLEFVYQRITNVNHDFGAIRPLSYFDPYFAIVMEEYPSRTLRQLLNEQRSSRTGSRGDDAFKGKDHRRLTDGFDTQAENDLAHGTPSLRERLPVRIAVLVSSWRLRYLTGCDQLLERVSGRNNMITTIVVCQ